MKKFFTAFSALLLSVSLCGCGRYIDDTIFETQPATDVAAPTTQPVAETVINAAAETYIYDNAKVLSPEAVTNCNNYAAQLYSERLINAAVVTTANLGGKSPYEYAQEAYNELYEGKGSGFLLLINNDTNTDYIYRTGSCQTYVTEDDVKQEIYWATKEIVSDDYEGAVLRLLKLAEKCPTHLFDNISAFSVEKGNELSSNIAACETELSVLITSNSTGTPNNELLQTYFDRRYSDGKGTMLLIDTVTKTVSVVSGGEISKELSSAVSKANAEAAKGNYEAAITAVTDALGGTKPTTVTNPKPVTTKKNS